MQTLQRVFGIKNLEGVLQGITPTAINRGIDLNISPRKHQQGGLELIHCVHQDTLNIQNRQSSQIQNALGHIRKTLVEMIGQINRANRKNWVAGEAHQQDPLEIC